MVNEIVFVYSLLYVYINVKRETGGKEDEDGNGIEKGHSHRRKGKGGEEEDHPLAPEVGRVTRSHPDGLRLQGRHVTAPSKGRRGSKDNVRRGTVSPPKQNTRGAPVVKLGPEAREAIKAHVEAMGLPLARRAVASLSTHPVDAKKGTSAKAAKDISLMKEVGSMTGAAMLAGCSKSTLSKCVKGFIEAVNGAVAGGKDVLELLAGMTKASLEKKRGGARAVCTKLGPDHLETLRQLATSQDTMTLTVKALRELLYRTHPDLRAKTISVSRLNAVLVHKLKITLKKLTRMAREGLTEVNLAKRKAYVREHYEGYDESKIGVPGPSGEADDMRNWRLKTDPRLYLFMDESGFNLTTTQATKGRSKRGKPASAAVKYNKGENHSLLLSLHVALPGMDGRIPRTWKKGGFKRMDFVQYIEDELAPFATRYRAALPAELRGQTIRYVMDNASIHKGEVVEEALAKIGLTATYLSPYSPVFNPCELIFGKVKRAIRNDERVAEDSDQLRGLVMEGLARVSSQDIEGFYRHCGLMT